MRQTYDWSNFYLSNNFVYFPYYLLIHRVYLSIEQFYWKFAYKSTINMQTLTFIREIVVLHQKWKKRRDEYRSKN